MCVCGSQFRQRLHLPLLGDCLVNSLVPACLVVIVIVVIHDAVKCKPAHSFNSQLHVDGRIVLLYRNM